LTGRVGSAPAETALVFAEAAPSGNRVPWEPSPVLGHNMTSTGAASESSGAPAPGSGTQPPTAAGPGAQAGEGERECGTWSSWPLWVFWHSCSTVPWGWATG